MIVHRTEMRDTVSRLLSKLTDTPLVPVVELEDESDAAPQQTAAEAAEGDG